MSPTDLSRLHDIVSPPPVPWWPPAPGWYVLGGCLVVLLAVAARRHWRRWRADAYRRAALAELDVIAARAPSAAAVSALLKRTALAAFPRTAVASLSGEAWLSFLDRTASPPATREDSFADGPGRTLATAPYDGTPLGADTASRLIEAARHWIENHRVPSAEG